MSRKSKRTRKKVGPQGKPEIGSCEAKAEGLTNTSDGTGRRLGPKREWSRTKKPEVLRETAEITCTRTERTRPADRQQTRPAKERNRGDCKGEESRGRAAPRSESSCTRKNTEATRTNTQTRRKESHRRTTREEAEPRANTREEAEPRTNGPQSTRVGPVSTKRQKIHMASSKAPNRKSMGVDIGKVALLALSRLFGEDEEIMEIDSPTLSLKRLLEEKAKNKSKGGAHGKRTKESAKASPSQMDPAEGPDSAHLTKFHFWLGFEAMERIAKEEGIAELFTDETIADRVTRGIPRKEAEELESVSISYPRVPQTLYPSERSDDIKGQHLNLTQLPQDIEIDLISNLSKDFHVAIHF